MDVTTLRGELSYAWETPQALLEFESSSWDFSMALGVGGGQATGIA